MKKRDRTIEQNMKRGPGHKHIFKTNLNEF